MHLLLRLLPKNCISFLTGRLAALRLPGFWGRLTVKLFAGMYRVDLTDAEKSIDQYPTVAALFTRRLKPGSRPIGGGLVSPVDGILRGYGAVQGGSIEQIKGRSYSVKELLGGSQYAPCFEEGCYLNLYLSPRDYHRVHAPLGGKVLAASHIPGKLWPVNDWSIARIDRLFAVNERVVTYLAGDHGLAAVVMVGATNVGKISLSYCDWFTNQMPFGFGPQAAGIRHCCFDPACEIEAGDELGIFHLGSTVVLLFEKGAVSPLEGLASRVGGPVRMGETLAVARTLCLD